MFQSLSGFFRPCNPSGDLGYTTKPKFQSLSGFFRPCNSTALDGLQGGSRVSIPVGFFQALQLDLYGVSHPSPSKVSIPVGFFQALQRRNSCSFRRRSSRVSIPVGFFQALQREDSSNCLLGDDVSIPVGFFQALQPGSPTSIPSPVNIVSIPVGFFQALQHRHFQGKDICRCVSIPVGFFQALQLLPIWTTVDRTRWFQSLSGFFRPCNTAFLPASYSISEFQSLSGFFRPCNGRIIEYRNSCIMCFNPCRVFSGLATLHALIQILSQVIVSIPVGFFQALQQRSTSQIYDRFFQFQSLSGFFRPCNADPHGGCPEGN